MDFGFLIDKKEFTFDKFKISPLNNFDNIIREFYNCIQVSNGWLYGPEEKLKKTSLEKKDFNKKAPCRPSSYFYLPQTHQIESNTDVPDDHLRFLIMGYGFLQGLYLVPKGFAYMERTAYKPGKLNGLLLGGQDYEKGMLNINEFYEHSNTGKRNRMLAVMHWFLIGQSYEFDWEIFDAQYKVLDGIYNISGVNANKHAQRPVALAQEYEVTLPSWAKLDQKGKTSKLSRLRNELIHEARYAGHPIGYTFTEENYVLELIAFNTKLIAGALGINTPYLKVSPERRAMFSWNIQP